MRRLVLVVAVVAGTLVLAGSALALHIPTTGEPIRLLNLAATPTTFPPDVPFFVRQGYVCLPDEKAICLDPATEFRLFVDGHQVPTALDLELNQVCPTGVTPSDSCSSRLNVANFRFGLLAGAHTFRGEWWNRGALAIVREATIEFVGQGQSWQWDDHRAGGSVRIVARSARAGRAARRPAGNPS